MLLYPNNTPASRNREVHTPIIAVLHHNGVDRRFKRPKGSDGKKSTSSLEPDQAFALLDAADRRDREFGLLCYTLAYTGRRIGEMLNNNTKLRNLNLNKPDGSGTIYLGKTKNGKPVMVYLPPHVANKFKAMPPRPPRKDGRPREGTGVPFLERGPDARVFRFHKGGALRKILAEVMVEAGLSFPKRERGFHLFCHTYATWMLPLTGDNYALARTGRWQDPRSAERYLHTKVSSEARRADLLPTPTRADRVQGTDKSLK